MKEISSRIVQNELVVSIMDFSPSEYNLAIEKVKKMSKKEKMYYSKQEKFPRTWHELFEDDETKWYKCELPYTTEFVNKIFDSGKGFMTHIGLKHTDLVASYKNGEMPKEFCEKIDQIRKNLSEHPRIIVLTTNFKEYSIFDGARRAVAFILEEKNIPVYVGQRDSFSSLPNFF